MKRRALLTLLSATLPIALAGGCAGIPMGALPRLYRLQGQLLELDPAGLMVALQVDARLSPPADAVPMLVIAIRPAQPGAFEPIDERLPMRFERVTTNDLGLPAPPPRRHWLLYGLTPASQDALRRIQAGFRRLRDEPGGPRGGSIAIGLAQDGMAPTDPAWAGSQWQTWLRTSVDEGFWAVWSGSIAELTASSREAAARR